MPAKSKAQLGKLFELQKQGKLKPGTAQEFARATPNISKLPAHVANQARAIRDQRKRMGK